MSFFNRKKICVTHDGTFHTDDLFATAVLYILNNGNIRIIRTRDTSLMENADYVYDVGGVYDFEKNRFDHHQKGGAGKRDNGIDYSSLGLVWRKYGEQICESKEIFEGLDRKIVQPIDAIDNGIDITKPIYEGVTFYGAEQVFLSNKPTWKEDDKNIDSIFFKEVRKVALLLEREIEVAKVDLEAKKIIIDSYNKSSDKRVVYLDTSFPRYIYQKTLSSFPDTIYTIMPSGHNNSWKAEAIAKSPETMESRKLFPEAWRGFNDGDIKFKEASGVNDAIFCHKSGFLMGAESREGIIALVEKALIS